MRLNSTKGVAMIVALALLTVVAGIMTLFFTRSVNELRHSADDVGIVRALMLARGAANLGSSVLQVPIRDELNTLVESRSADGCWTFGDDNACQNGDVPDPSSVIQDFAGIRSSLQSEINTIVCDDLSTDSQQTMRVRIFVSGSGCPQTGGGNATLPTDIELPDPRFVSGSPRNKGTRSQTYALPYVMISEGSTGDYTRRVVQQGEFQFTVGQTSFSRYGLFTNVHALPNGGGDIFFTQDTLFDGPVHTNQTFNFFRNAWFGGKVTSAGCTSPLATTCQNGNYEQGANFFGAGFQDAEGLGGSPSFTNSAGTHAPELTAGVDWQANFIPLPENNQTQQNDAEGVDENGNKYDEDGNKIPGGIPLNKIFDDINSLELRATDSDMNPLTKDRNGNWTPEATYQYVEACNDFTLAEGTNEEHVREYCFELRFDENNQVEIREPLTIYNQSSVWASPDEYKEGKTTLNAAGFVVAREPDGERRRYLKNTYSNGEDYLGDLYDALGSFNNECAKCVAYVDGRINRFKGPDRTPANSDDPDDAPPAIASFSQMTVAADKQVRITGDLKYEDPPCSSNAQRTGDSVTSATCDNQNAENVLGIYVQGTGGNSNNDILIGNNHDDQRDAPDNVTVHAVLMSSQGAVTVEDSDEGVARGTMNLLGGVIENFYGPFGTFDANTGDMGTGYSRNFTYDPRMRSISPPSFPGIAQDSVLGVIPLSFGQREQLY